MKNMTVYKGEIEGLLLGIGTALIGEICSEGFRRQCKIFEIKYESKGNGKIKISLKGNDPIGMDSALDALVHGLSFDGKASYHRFLDEEDTRIK